jgi:hypothetical protein
VPAAPAPQPAASDNVSPPVAPSAPAPQVNPAYAQGGADWDALQKWFVAQSGDRFAGANYWAANRHVQGHASCTVAAEHVGGASPLFAAGCEDAQRILTPIDERRADPQYRTGFNDEAKQHPLPSAAASTDGEPIYATVSTINLNLRAGPGVDYPSVVIVPEGTKVRILKDAGDGWDELEIPGSDGQAIHGFANGSFLTPAQ